MLTNAFIHSYVKGRVGWADRKNKRKKGQKQQQKTYSTNDTVLSWIYKPEWFRQLASALDNNNINRKKCVSNTFKIN